MDNDAGWRDGVTDDGIMSQQDEIQRAIEQSQPLVSDKEAPGALIDEYRDNPAFVGKLQEFAIKYDALRRVRGDGNCFYRAFLIGVAEYFASAGVCRPAGFADADAYGAAQGSVALCSVQPSDPSPQARYEATLKYVRDSLPALVALGWSEYTTGDFRDAMLSWLWQVGKAAPSDPPVSHQSALGPLGYHADDGMDSFFVLTYLRCLCALELRSKEDDYFPWVIALAPECSSVKDFCDSQVEAVRTDADQLQIMALAKAWDAAVKIAYFDASASGAGSSSSGGNGIGSAGLSIITFPEGQPPATSSSSSSATPGSMALHFLYRPGHYDVAYPK